jgi:stage III sporulation protein AG
LAKVRAREGSVGRAARSLLDGRGRIILGLAAAGALLVLFSGLFGTASPPSKPPPKATKPPATHTSGQAGAGTGTSDPVLAYEGLLDRSVEAVLDQVRGAGAVSVAVTVSRSPSQELVRNLSSSHDRQGTSDSSSLDEALAYGKDDVPVTTGEQAPPLVGALVVAPGAEDPLVRAELTQAVETLLGLPANQVIVLPGREGGS